MKKKPRAGKASVDRATTELFRMSRKKALGRAEAERRPFEERKILSVVTGGSGRLGRYLVKALLERGEQVRVLQHAGRKADFPEGVEAVQGDLLDRASLESAVDGADYVYHLAAIVDPGAPYDRLLDVNYHGTRNLLEACRSRAYHMQRFVFISSISVYGKDPAEIPADEETAENPTDNYGRSKLLAEQAVGQYAEKVPYVILRPGVIYAPGFDEAYLPVLKALEHGKMRIVGSGDNSIPFIHASDVVRAMLLASRAEKAVGDKYVIAPAERKTQKQVFEIACRCLGVRPPGAHISAWLAKLNLKFARLAGAISGSRPKITEEYIDILASNRVFRTDKAKEDLGFEPKVALEDGIREMVDYYRSKGGA